MSGVSTLNHRVLIACGDIGGEIFRVKIAQTSFAVLRQKYLVGGSHKEVDRRMQQGRRDGDMTFGPV